jgi:hypothetical protein
MSYLMIQILPEPVRDLFPYALDIMDSPYLFRRLS